MLFYGMSPSAAELPYLVYSLTVDLFPFLVVISLLNGLIFPHLRGLTWVALLGGGVCCIIGAALGHILEEATVLGWGSMTALVLALGLAESGYFFVFSGGLFAKSMISESLACFIASLIIPFLYFFIWIS
jgi:hypothetical protein